MVDVVEHLPHKVFFIVIPSLGEWLTKAKEAPSCHRSCGKSRVNPSCYHGWQKYQQKHKKIRVLLFFCCKFTALMSSDSIFDLLNRVTDGSFFIFMKNIIQFFFF